ncbi:MAG: hypothetical protein FJX54_10495 [Alphaproteobacteria bacterium]|nr:hypothetical protein [Alphaproteobacteria bacterium]
MKRQRSARRRLATQTLEKKSPTP